MYRQTVIPTQLGDEISLENFSTARNGLLVEELEKLLKNPGETRTVYLWGEPGCGKSHLLNACCNAKQHRKEPFQFLSMGQVNSILDIRDRVEPGTLVCLDDIQNVRGLHEAQDQLLGLYEKVVSLSGSILASGNAPLDQVRLELDDLTSRLSSGGGYPVHALNDREKMAALKMRAENRGFALDDHVIAFIMSHCRRDTGSLFTLLDKLDSASLQAKRKVTIPFVRSLL